MSSLLGFGTEKESFERLVKLVRHPVKFFEESDDEEEDFINFATFMLRISYIGLLVKTILTTQYWVASAIIMVVFIIIARLLVRLFLYIGSVIQNLFVKIFSDRDDRTVVKRIMAFASVTYILTIFSFLKVGGFIIHNLLMVVGISKQLDLSISRSTLIVLFLPAIIFLLVGSVSFYAWGLDGAIEVLFKTFFG